MAHWKEIGQGLDPNGKIIFREMICIYCNAFCRKVILPKERLDYCIDTPRRQKSVLTPTGCKVSLN